MYKLGAIYAAALVCLGWLALSAEAQQPRLDELLDREMPTLVATYKKLHATPELSLHEKASSAFLAAELRALGYTVAEHIGKYEHSEWTAYGVVAVLKNGDGQTVMVRTDLDALPVEETTGLAYASKIRTKNDAGQDVGVMHACGHDVHIASLLGTAKMLVDLKDQWRGTLLLIGQPAEETGDGAKAMLADQLYTRFPKPDYALALHDVPDLEAGKVGYTPGYAMASSTTMDVIVRGVSGHGAMPETTKDPIVSAAQLILALQTIVSRENSPLDPIVVTVGSIHGGTKHNIVPDEVHLQLSVRAYKEEVRQRILASIERMTKGVALTAGIPAERAPVITFRDPKGTPAVFNDPALTGRLATAFKKTLGAANVVEWPPRMVSEDFGRFGLEGHQIPTCIFWLGGVDPAKIVQSRQGGPALPSLHSSVFAPEPEPTIRTGIRAMTAAVLELMKK